MRLRAADGPGSGRCPGGDRRSPPPLASRAAGPAQAQLSAQIRYTTGGVPHILAHELAGPRFRLRVRVRPGQPVHDGERLRDGRGAAVPVLRAHRRGHRARQRASWSATWTPTCSTSRSSTPVWCRRWRRRSRPTEQQVEAGYVKGYNAYLAHVGGSAGVPDPTCRGQAWVKPITVMDSYLRFYQLMLLSSSGDVIQGIARPHRRRPGTAPAQTTVPPPPPDRARDRRGAAGAAGQHGQQRGRDRLRGHQGSPRPAARQPALPVDRHGALLPVAAHHPRQDQRHRGVAVRRAADPDRPQRVGGVEPHRVDRVPVHPVPAHPGARPSDRVPAERQGRWR